MLRMSRPGKPLTKKGILLQTKMAELEKGDKCSNTLLANVLDMDDDFIAGSLLGDNTFGLQAAALWFGIVTQPRSNAWLDVDPTRWRFPSKVSKYTDLFHYQSNFVTVHKRPRPQWLFCQIRPFTWHKSTATKPPMWPYLP